MANTICKTRTNYASVTDENELRRIIGLCVTTDGDDINVITKTDENGETRFGFYVESDISGYLLDEKGNIVDPKNDDYDDDDDDDAEYETSFDRFIEDLQKIIVPGDALIITSISYEKMRWLAGNFIVVTRDKAKFVDMSDIALETTREILDNPDWCTEMHY